MTCTSMYKDACGGSRVGSINLHQGLSLVLTLRVHSLGCVETLLITFFRIQFEDTCFSTGGDSSEGCRQRYAALRFNLSHKLDAKKKTGMVCGSFFSVARVLTFSPIAWVPYEAKSCKKMVRGSILAARRVEIKASETLKLGSVQLKEVKCNQCNLRGGRRTNS